MFAALVLAALCALATNVAFLMKHRGAVAAPRVDGRHPVRTAADLFRERWWALGWAVAVVAWGLHVAALALASLSVVQAVISGGLVFLAVIAQRFFGLAIGKREWLGLSLTAVGLAFLFLTAGPGADDGGSDHSLGALIAFECGVLLLGGLLVLVSLKVEPLRHREGPILGIAAGALFGVSDVAIKYLIEPVLDNVFLGLLSPWTAAAVIASVVAFYSSARGLQLGPAIAVITMTSVAANLAAIAGGILVFQDPIGEGAVAIVGRVLAFGLVIFGAAAMPGPVKHGARREARGGALRGRLVPGESASAGTGGLDGPPQQATSEGMPSPRRTRRRDGQTEGRTQT